MDIIPIDLSKAVSLNDHPHKGRRRLVLFLLIIVCLFFTVLGYWFLPQGNTISKAVVIRPTSQLTLSLNNVTLTTIRKQMTKEVVGFLPSWMAAKNARVDVSRLTHLIYFGLGVNENGELVKVNEDGNPVLEWSYFTGEYFSQLRKDAALSNIKVLVALKNFDNTNIDTLISNETATKQFIKELAFLIKEYDLDGINIDFEYFTDTDFPTAQYLNLFLEKVTKGLKKDNPNLLISFDVNAVAVLVDSAYDMVKIGEIVDQVILMAYDYHRPNSTLAGPVAPISGGDNEHSVTQSLDSLMGRVPSEKILLGIPFYGYEWQTLSEKYKSTTIANTGALASYQRIQELLNNREDIATHWDESSLSPWLVYKQSGAIKQIYYENEESIAHKINLVEKKKLGGISIWALGYEGDYQDLWQPIVEYQK